MKRFYRFISAIPNPSLSSIPAYYNKKKISTSNSNNNPFIFKYLIDNCGFSETQAQTTSIRLTRVKYHAHKPDSVLSLLRQSGFSQTHIQNTIRVNPQILFADTEKTLKPKLAFLQELGLTGSDLGQFVSNNSTILTMSLNKKLLPCIGILKKIVRDKTQLIKVLQRSNRIVFRDPDSRLLPNISLLQSCGIVDSQLSMLLKRQPMLFEMKKQTLSGLVERVKEMGFSADSRMFVYALYTVSCISHEKMERKLKLFGRFGFSREEAMEMFKRVPSLMRTSEGKLELGLRCFSGAMGEDLKGLVLRCPGCLMFSIEKRVLPRIRVVGILRAKMLLKKEPSVISVMQIPEAEFLQKYILKYVGDLADELLLAYKGNAFIKSCDV